MKRRNFKRMVSDRPVDVIGKVSGGSKVTIAVVRGDVFTVQVRNNYAMLNIILSKMNSDISSRTVVVVFAGISRVNPADQT